MDLKTSLLVNHQLPEFIRSEYPLFVSFIEAYYEFLETQMYVDGVGQKNDLIQKLKDLKNVTDIDYSLSQFEEQFFNTFANFFPKETAVSKEFLLKNILPLYQSKGTQRSFEFLFRLLFGEEIRVEYPGDNILRASDGKWIIENILRTELEIYSEYISDGIQTTFNLPYEIDPNLIQIYVDDVIFENYYIRKELKKIYFKETIPENSKIKIFYFGSFDLTIFKNRQIIGTSSGAKAVVEKIARRNVNQLNFYQFFINDNNTEGIFRNGEIVKIDILTDNQEVILFYLQTLSDVESINIIQPGSNYKVGDPVILRGAASEPAIVVVNQVSTGNIENLSVQSFGAGYKIGNEIFTTDTTENFSAIVDAVDDSGTISPNTFEYNNVDIITNYLDTLISSSDYGFPANNVTQENLSTVISDALSSNIITNLGPMTNALVTFSEIPSNLDVNFQINSTLLYDDVRIIDYGSIGTIKIISGGSGYTVGDEIIFTNTVYFSGQGAKANVSAVDSSGAITRVSVINGGKYYSKQYLPSLSVQGSGNGAVLQVEYFMGEGGVVDYDIGDGITGKILSFEILNPGKGYTVTPIADLNFSGNGDAVAEVNIRSSFVKLPGRWTTTDGLLSTDEVRLQGNNYYIDFSYVITSQVEFQRYRDIIKNLLNPVGSINYARYGIIQDVITGVSFNISDELIRQISGTVSTTSNSYFVYGDNTYFEVANTLGIFTEGTVVSINSEVRIVNTIINNTSFTVSDDYINNSNNQFVNTVTLPYRSVTTEYWKELAITVEGPKNDVLTTEERT